MRIEAVALDPIAGDGLDPLGLDRGGAAREQPRRFGKLRGEHPFRRLARDTRAGMQMKADAARAVVASILVLHSDVRQQSREERLMDDGIAARVDSLRQLRVPLPSGLGELRRKLLVNVAPFAQT